MWPHIPYLSRWFLSIQPLIYLISYPFIFYLHMILLPTQDSSHLAIWKSKLWKRKCSCWHVRATPIGLLNGLSSPYLLGGCKKLISSRPSKWTAILVGILNFSPHPQFGGPLFGLPTMSPLYKPNLLGLLEWRLIFGWLKFKSGLLNRHLLTQI